MKPRPWYSGLATIVTLVFVVLKLTGLIDWSWWWVLSPMLVTVFLIGLAYVFVGMLLVKIAESCTPPGEDGF